MLRVLFASAVLVLLVVVVVAAQPPLSPPLSPVAPPALPTAPPSLTPLLPTGVPGGPLPPMPPRPFPVPGAAGAPAAAPAPNPGETPLGKFRPIEAFPAVTQDAVRAALLGGTWLGKMNQPNGRFLHGYLPALRQPMSGDHDLRQAQAALAMAQVAKFAGDEKQAAVASQAILALLAATKLDANDPSCRTPVQSSLVCNRVAFAALVALAVYELPNPADKLVEDAERLCKFLRTQIRVDGSVHYADGPGDDPLKVDPSGVNEFPGLALQALVVSNRARPAEWKKDAVKKGVAHYHAVFRARPHPALADTLAPAAAEFYLQTRAPEAAAAVFDMTDWLCQLQISATDPKNPQWAGGFRAVADGRLSDAPPHASDTGRHVQSLACAYHVTRATGDLPREQKYRPAAADAVQFLCGLQFLEANTRHFEDTFRAKMLIGAFHLSPADGNLRIEATACAITGLLRFLSSGAQTAGN